jgi:hypothetical protein
MSNFASYSWKLLSGAANISASAIPVVGIPLTFIPTFSSGVVDTNGNARQIKITSAGNASTSSFTISGSYLGIPVTCVMNGPNATSIYSPQAFDTITRIVPTAVAAGINVSVGIAESGNTGWFPINEYSNMNLSFSVNITAGTMSFFPMIVQDSINPNAVSFDTVTGKMNTPVSWSPNAARNLNVYEVASNIPGKFACINVINTLYNSGTFLASIYQPHGRK